jgi:hypothetical protein
LSRCGSAGHRDRVVGRPQEPFTALGLVSRAVPGSFSQGGLAPVFGSMSKQCVFTLFEGKYHSPPD